jgi:iron-sulfur cluster repair protein YtfE (RIC family)
MNMMAVPGALEDPLESLLEFHRRIERELASLCHLPVHLEIHGADAAAMATARASLDFFGQALPLHHADEEADLLPLLSERVTACAERQELREMRMRLEQDHRDMDHAWRQLVGPLASLAHGVACPVPQDLVRYFRAVHAMHITIEEAAVHLLAARRLGVDDRAILAQRMQARRAVTGASRN